jgi:hypothetical protein
MAANVAEIGFYVASLALRSGLRQEGMVCCLIFTQRLSLVPRCGTREHTGLTCGRAYVAGV